MRIRAYFNNVRLKSCEKVIKQDRKKHVEPGTQVITEFGKFKVLYSCVNMHWKKHMRTHEFHLILI